MKQVVLLIDELKAYIDDYLSVSKFKDYCHNGLQVPASSEIKKLAFAVTASKDVIEKCASSEVDALLVHHGLFWGKGVTYLDKNLSEKLTILLENKISLLAYHLPLDCHLELGNNVELLKLMGFEGKPYFLPGFPDGLLWSFDCDFSSPDEFLQKLRSLNFKRSVVYGADEKPLRKGFLCTGAAEDLFSYIPDADDCFYITGEVQEKTQLLAEERSIPLFTCGHHETELFGVLALANHLAAKYGFKLLDLR